MSEQQEQKAISIHLHPSSASMETSYSDTGVTGTDLRWVFPALGLAVTLLIIAGQEVA